VTLGRRYLAGVAAVGAVGALLVLAVPETTRREVLWGAVVGLALQAPLGWWALRSLGSDHFMLSWGLGMLVRFTVVALAGLTVVPALGYDAGPMLGTMVGVLVALLLVEGVTAARETSREDER
jgi:heme A synthase